MEYLLYLQDLREATNDVLTSLLLYVTKFGEYLIPFSVFAVIYWCIDKRIGVFLILSCGFSMMFNLLIKNIACIYRPWILDTRIKPVEAALKYAGGYSFPSGHTTIAVSCWGAIGVFWRHIKGMLPLMILLCLLIAFSRNYVGVHTFQDVAVAAIVSALILVVGWRVFCWVEKKEKRDLILTILVSLFSILLSAYICFKSYPLEFADGVALIDPYKCKLEVFSKLGFVLGGFWGWYLERKYIRFEVCGSELKSLFKRATGGLLPLFLLLGFVSIFCKCFFQEHCACFCGLFIISFYITFVYPLIFSWSNRQRQ